MNSERLANDIALTRRQRELIRHAIGLNGKRKKSYRNRFWAAPGSTSYDEMCDLVALGAATFGIASPTMKEFNITSTGAHAALSDGESLDLEDFLP